MPVRRRLPFIRTLLALTSLLLLGVLGATTLWRLERICVAPGSLSGGSVTVCAPRDGLVAEVMVRSGQRARAGDPLLRLDTRELAVEADRRAATLDAMETSRRSGATRLKHLMHEVHPREREDAARAVERSELKLSQAEIAAQAIARLGQEGIAGQLQVRQSELDRRLAAVGVTEARQTLSLLAEKQRSERDALEADIRRLEEEIKAERVQREAVLSRIEASLVRAGAEGVVVTPEMDELVGRAVRAGDEILRLGIAGPRLFVGVLSDTARAQVRPHQPVKIRLEAYPWLLHGTVRGEVVGVSDRRAEAGFPVEIELEPSAAIGPLNDGMRGTARIAIGERMSLLRLFLESAAGKAGA